MAAQLGHVYQDNPSTNEQAADRQCIEISYTKNTEKQLSSPVLYQNKASYGRGKSDN